MLLVEASNATPSQLHPSQPFSPAAGPCEQQDAADNQIDLAKQLNSQQMIALSQIFAQQPRNSPNSVSIPYCQKAPKNQELTGLFQCQFQGSNKQVFVGGVQVGGPGTIPFGRNAPVQPQDLVLLVPVDPFQMANSWLTSSRLRMLPLQLVLAETHHHHLLLLLPCCCPTPSQCSTPQDALLLLQLPQAITHLMRHLQAKDADGRAAQQLNAKFATLTPGSQCSGKKSVHLQPANC
jgi:hypothetical protein